MKRGTKCALGGGCALVVLVLAPFVALIVQSVRHDRWVSGRLETFANYSYAEWQQIHNACGDLVEAGNSLSVSRDGDGWDKLPAVLTRTEPMRIWVDGNRVTLRYSGGHARFVHIEFSGGTEPQTELIAEWMYTGVVYPSEDQRTVAEKRLDEGW